MIRRGGKTKKKRFEKLKVLYKDEEKRLRFLGSLEYDEVSYAEDDYEYEADDEEYEDLEEEMLEAELAMDLGI